MQQPDVFCEHTVQQNVTGDASRAFLEPLMAGFKKRER